MNLHTLTTMPICNLSYTSNCKLIFRLQLVVYDKCKILLSYTSNCNSILCLQLVVYVKLQLGIVVRVRQDLRAKPPTSLLLHPYFTPTSLPASPWVGGCGWLGCDALSCFTGRNAAVWFYLGCVVLAFVYSLGWVGHGFVRFSPWLC